MKKTLLLLLSALAFSVSSFANYDGDGDNGHCVITDMTWSTNGGNRPRIYSSQFVDINLELNLITVKATPEIPVSLKVVNLSNGSMEEQTYNTYFNIPIAHTFSLEYVINWGDGDVTLCGSMLQDF